MVDGIYRDVVFRGKVEIISQEVIFGGMDEGRVNGGVVILAVSFVFG